jgi:hypothetical protein
MTATARAFTGIGGVLDVIGIVLLIEHGPKHASPWLWISAGLLAWMRGRRIPGRVQMDRIQMTTGATPAPYSPKRRWLPRLLTDEEREDLASRCEACSREGLSCLRGSNSTMGVPPARQS